MPVRTRRIAVPRAVRWGTFASMIGACAACAALVGCRAAAVRPEGGVASTPAAAVAPVFYPGPPARAHIVAMGPLTGHALAAKPPGKLRRAVTGETAGPALVSELLRPLSLTVRAGQILVVDVGRNAIVQIDPGTGEIRSVALKGMGEFFRPVAIATDGQGDLYVADAQAGRVIAVGSGNTVLRTYRLGDSAPFAPIDLAVSAERLYVVNRAGRRVEIFERDSGRYVGPFANSGPGRSAFPVGVALDGEGNVYVVDMAASRVRVYDPGGVLLRQIGAPGDRPGLLAQPRSVAVGPDGITYVSDAATQIVQMFRPPASLLMYFGGTGGTIGSMTMPAKVITDRTLLQTFASRLPAGFVPQYMIFVANQFGPGRIGVYAFGQVPPAGEEPTAP